MIEIVVNEVKIEEHIEGIYGLFRGRKAVVGGSGLNDSSIVETALTNDLECVVVSRTRHESNEAILDSFESKGAEIQFAASEDVSQMTEALTGADAIICTMGESRSTLPGNLDPRLHVR